MKMFIMEMLDDADKQKDLKINHNSNIRENLLLTFCIGCTPNRMYRGAKVLME